MNLLSVGSFGATASWATKESATRESRTVDKICLGAQWPQQSSPTFSTPAKENLNPNSNFPKQRNPLLGVCFLEWKSMTRAAAGTIRLTRPDCSRNGFNTESDQNRTSREYNNSQEQIQQLLLRKSLRAWKETVQEERLLRTVHALAEKQLLGKAFQVLRKLITREAAAEAQLHLRKTELMFAVFDRWKKHCKRKQKLQELSLSLAEGLQLKRKMEAIERLCQYKSRAERSFVQDRIVARFRHQHLLELFYPFKRVITHLVDVRVASIKLSSYLATSRSRQALRRLGTHASRTFQLLRGYRQYKERETLRRLLEKWLKLSQTNFVHRKQYELSVLFHKTRLERKVLNLMTERTADGRPLRHVARILEKWLKRTRCANTFRMMSKTVHEIAQPKQAAAVLRLDILGPRFRLFRTGCLQERQRKQRNWQTRRLAAYLKKKLQICRRSAAMQLFVVHSRHSMSKTQLNGLAKGYFRRRVMVACWQALLPG